MFSKFVIIFLLGVTQVYSYSLSFFNHWHCIGIKDTIDFKKPYVSNIGDLPLVTWMNPVTNKLTTMINICKHMGSKLNNAKVIDTGCLKCQYHGLEFSNLDKFGETVEHEGKIFWAYSPKNKTPYNVPFYNNKDYETSCIQIDMDGSLPDSAYNSMDLRHPEYVHGNIFGFGSSIPPVNIKQYLYSYKNKITDRVGLSFNYKSNRVISAINNNKGLSHNFHMYIYPSFSWSKVTFNNDHLIIGLNLLPLAENKTRWFVTICHNYKKSDFGKNLMKMLASTILGQDRIQMANQHKEDPLKKAMLFDYIFKDEEVIEWLHTMFQEYKYPSIEMCAELYRQARQANQLKNQTKK